MEWQPYETMPKSVRVFCINRRGPFAISSFHATRNGDELPGRATRANGVQDVVTHWMPVKEPPKQRVAKISMVLAKWQKVKAKMAEFCGFAGGREVPDESHLSFNINADCQQAIPGFRQ